MTSSALRVIDPSLEDNDALAVSTRARLPLAHLTTSQVADAMRRCGGNLSQAAQALHCARWSLYRRINAEPSLSRNQGRDPGVVH